MLIQSLIVFKVGVSFIHSSLYLFLIRQNGKSTRYFPKSSPENHLIDHENHHGSKQLKTGVKHFPYSSLWPVPKLVTLQFCILAAFPKSTKVLNTTCKDIFPRQETMKHLNEEQKSKLKSSFAKKSHAAFIRDVQKELSKNGFYDKFMK